MDMREVSSLEVFAHTGAGCLGGDGVTFPGSGQQCADVAAGAVVALAVLGLQLDSVILEGFPP